MWRIVCLHVQAITSAGSGAKAALDAERYLSTAVFGKIVDSL